MAVLTVMKDGVEVALPSPLSVKVGDEIIWSSNTGRSTAGDMMGDVVAEKKTLNVTWGILTSNQFNLIKTSLRAGFFVLKVNIDGAQFALPCYRGTIESDAMGKLSDGTYYYRSVTVDLIEQ